MTGEAWPFDGPLDGDGNAPPMSELQWDKVIRLAFPTGVVGAPGSNVRKVTADATGPHVTRGPGRSALRSHMREDPDPLDVAIPSNATGSVRIDRIVDHLDISDNSITTIRIAGTPGAGLPALELTDSADYDLQLAKVTVPAGFNSATDSISGSQVEDDRLFVTPSIVGCIKVTQITSPAIDQMVFESSTGTVKKWNGSQWKSLTNMGVLSRVNSGIDPIYGAMAHGDGGVVRTVAGIAVPAGATQALVHIDVSGRSNINAAGNWRITGAQPSGGVAIEIDHRRVHNQGVPSRPLSGTLSGVLDLIAGDTQLTVEVSLTVDPGGGGFDEYGVGAPSVTFLGIS